MARLIGILVIALAVSMAAVLAGAVRIDEWQSQMTLEIDGHDSTGFVASDKHSIINVVHDDKYDAVRGWIYMERFAETDSTIAGEGLVDTGIVIVYAGTDWDKTEIHRDTLALPDSSDFLYYEYWPPAGDTSASGVWLYDAPKDGLMHDHFWIEVRGADTAGTSGSLAAVVRWRFRFFEF